MFTSISPGPGLGVSTSMMRVEILPGLSYTTALCVDIVIVCDERGLKASVNSNSSVERQLNSGLRARTLKMLCKLPERTLVYICSRMISNMPSRSKLELAEVPHKAPSIACK